MAKAQHLLCVAMALAVGGCAAITETWDAWFGEPPAPMTTAAAADQGEEVFYAAVDGLAVHALPSGSSQIVARLSVYQRVTRIGLARGYANVSTDAGLRGWVDNAQLLWRLPAAAAAAAPAAPGAETAVDTPVPDGDGGQ